jgi:hypothetical protein
MWKLYPSLLGEDDTPDKTLLETRMVRANLESRKGILAQVPKDGEFFFMFCFSFVLYLLNTIYFLLLFKLLVVKLDVQDLKLHYFLALNARANATSPVMIPHGSPACHVVGNTLAVTLLLTQMSNW